MPYEYKREEGCIQKSGKKGKFVTKKKGQEQKCWGSEEKFNSAQKARHASNSSDKKKEDNLLLDLDENEKPISEVGLRQVINFLILEFTRKKKKNISFGGGGYYDEDDYDDYYDDSHYLEAGLTYDDLEGYSDEDYFDDEDYSYYYDDDVEDDEDD